MLTKYKNDYSKIAMGFLSFEPDLKDMGHLKTELKLYTEDNAHVLYLYREAAGGDFEGVVGVELGTDFALVRHLSLSPAVRDTATQYAVLDDLAALYPERRLMGTLENAPLVAGFNQQRKEAGHAADTGLR
ncbi:N-acetyltransferase [Lacticaseibacillus parakribbianus]|uniref:N-acetyltransferase n=1 Tax=Lacticaseibacillus parakribbianus TaxID=2970927 RepID=UPI0021CB4EFE|nr:N-acetyltransferase [Lacticaseibacillus parakribbianus]